MGVGPRGPQTHRRALACCRPYADAQASSRRQFSPGTQTGCWGALCSQGWGAPAGTLMVLAPADGADLREQRRLQH